MVGGMRDAGQGLVGGHFLVAGHGDDLFHTHLSIQEDVVQATVEAPHVVGVGWLSAGALELEGAEELHGALLLRPSRAPVRVAGAHRALAQELEQA